MKIAMLGTGIVGQTLGKGFIDAGHDVMMGSREPDSEKVQTWLKEQGARASAGTFAQAAAFGDIAVLCTLWTGTQSAIQMIDPDNLAGKIVIDTTNPLEFPQNAAPQLSLGFTTSAGEQVQGWLPQAHVVKAFNTVGAELMVKPSFPDGPPTMPICGNNDLAKDNVAKLCKMWGWDVLDAGDISASRLLEPLCVLWVHTMIRTGSRDFAFKVVKK